MNSQLQTRNDYVQSGHCRDLVSIDASKQALAEASRNASWLQGEVGWRTFIRLAENDEENLVRSVSFETIT